jgi:hypothetical protein
MQNSTWLEILNKVKTGELSIEEAAQRLEDMEAGVEEPVYSGEALRSSEAEVFQPDLGWWKNAWQIPLWVGIAIFVLSAFFMAWAFQTESLFWFYCSWLPLLLGLFVLFIGVWSQQARWAHVRVQEKDGTRVSISLPLPVRLASWFLRVFGPRISGLREKHLEELPAVLDALSSSDDPISVEVDDEDGDRVRVYIL